MSALPDALPERVRARVVSYAAQALGGLAPDHVPAALKRVASFAPTKRARLAGEQIIGLLGTDEDFRDRIAVQVRAQHPEAVAELSGETPGVAGAALAVLEQPEGWEELLAATARAEEEGQAAAAAENAGEELVRLRDRLAAAEAEAVERGRKARVEQDRLKAENADLRRKLGETRAELRRTGADADAARDDVDRLREEQVTATSADQAALRRLRAQVEGLEAEITRLQRTTRSARDEGSVRARMLLDTLLQAGEGLRKELGLPVVEGTPADSVAAELAQEGSRDSTARGSMRPDDPAHLEQLLALPKMHLIVDGYNVTHAAWPESTLEIQRSRLLSGLASLAARSRVELTVVFDSQYAEHRPVVQVPRGVRVLFSPKGTIADDVIRDLVAAEPDGRVVAVVTDDAEIVRDVRRKPGVRPLASRALVGLISR